MSQRHKTGSADFRRATGRSRREVLCVGGLWGSTLALSDLFRARATATEAGSFGRAKSVIMLYLHGGHAQQETFDPKPDGPQPARGEFNAIATSLPGVQFSELLPHTANRPDFSACDTIRSLSIKTCCRPTSESVRSRRTRI